MQVRVQEALSLHRGEVNVHGARRIQERVFGDGGEIDIPTGDRMQPAVLELPCSPEVREFTSLPRSNLLDHRHDGVGENNAKKSNATAAYRSWTPRSPDGDG
jgi:hypothetical protein